jgi:hypothetical protein
MQAPLLLLLSAAYSIGREMQEENGCGEAAWVADKAYRFRAAFLIIGEQNGSRHSRRMPISLFGRGGIALPFRHRFRLGLASTLF